MHTKSDFARRALAALGALAITTTLMVGSITVPPQAEMTSRILA